LISHIIDINFNLVSYILKKRTIAKNDSCDPWNKKKVWLWK